MSVLAVVGSRTWTDKERVYAVLDEWIEKNGKPARLISGGATGTDQFAEEYAHARGIAIEVIKPDYSTGLGKGAPLERNKVIMSKATAVVAFCRGRTGGTQHAIAQARMRGVEPVIIDG